MLTNNEIKINKTQHPFPALYILLRAVSSTSTRGTEERTKSSERGRIIGDGCQAGPLGEKAEPGLSFKQISRFPPFWRFNF